MPVVEQRKRSFVESVTTKVNHLTNKTEETTHNAIRDVPREPDFVKMYLNDVRVLSGIPHQVFEIFLCMLHRLEYNNEIVLNSSIKKSICEKLSIYRAVPDSDGVAKQEPYINVVDQAINKLVKSGILFRESSGVYKTNPHLIAKGKWTDIRKIRLEITYDEDVNRFVQVSSESKTDNNPN